MVAGLVAGLADLAGMVGLVVPGLVVLEDIHKVGMGEGEGILGQAAGTILEVHHRAYQDIQDREGQEVQEGHRDPSQQGEEGRRGDIERVVQKEDRQEDQEGRGDHPEVEDLAVEHLVAQVPVGFGQEPVLDYVPGGGIRSV